jgi:hypothetical protein
MQSQNFKPRDPKTPLDVDIDNIAYNETYEEDLEYYGLEEIIDPDEISDTEWNVIWADEEEFDVWDTTLQDGLDDMPNDLFVD